MLKFLRSLKFKIAVAVIAVSALVGVAVFDTYPTYLKKELALTPDECSQVATLVAVYAYSLQNPGEGIPDGVKAELDAATRVAKRVAKYVIEKSGPEAFNTAPPAFVYMMLMQGCEASGGHVTLN